LHRASADLLEGADVPARMMQAGAVGAREGDHVMVAAVDAVHEGDVAARPVGEAGAKKTAVEGDSLLDIRGEQEDVGEATRPRRYGLRAEGGVARAIGRGGHLRADFLVRRALFGDPDLEQSTFMVMEPHAVALEAG